MRACGRGTNGRRDQASVRACGVLLRNQTGSALTMVSDDRQVLLGADCVCAAKVDSGTIERRAVQERLLVR